MGSNQSGRHDGGVDVEQAGDVGRDSYDAAENDVGHMRIPVLLHSDRPHERLYVAAMDGTGNSLFDDKQESWSAVAKIHLQVRALEDEGIRSIATGYVEGTYTQNGLLKLPEKLADGRFGHTFDERVETAYLQLCEQAKSGSKKTPRRRSASQVSGSVEGRNK